MLHPVIRTVTDRIAERSTATRAQYLEKMRAMHDLGVQRASLGCGNLAHGFAGCVGSDKQSLRTDQAANIAIVSAYNEMLSAHQPYHRFPDIIKAEAHKMGAVAQFAGGVPAMCDGVTQGMAGMELSLFSRDVIAMATAVALSHRMFDAVLCLGICDKIVPGLLIGALSFAHLPVVFVPAGPMPSGLPNKEKARIRQLHATGQVDDTALLEAESASYHSPGTCTFYGTANSNQMLMEIMGLQLPGSSFIAPNTPLRDALTRSATQQVLRLTAQHGSLLPLYEVMAVENIVNGIIGLLSTGGSTNHTLHLVAIARAAGIIINWDDFDELSGVIPQLTRIYPNGEADVNHFHEAGGMGFLIRELLDAGLLHEDVRTIRSGETLRSFAQAPILNGDTVNWTNSLAVSGDDTVLRPANDPFSPEGGMKVVDGNMGRGIVKMSAVTPEHRNITAPAKVFTSQQGLQEAFKAGKLNGDFIAVVLYQGPKANGMPELHKLTPPLGVMQDMGFKVALVTDGRMSGASGKVPAAIHITPEASQGGAIGRIRDGDMITLNAETGELTAHVPTDEWEKRGPYPIDLTPSHYGTGRELFAPFRNSVCGAEQGASVLGFAGE